MELDKLFKNGVTPKTGERAGERFRVVSVNEHEVAVREWESGRFVESFAHGTYEMWQPPKTIFEDSSIKSTWGNLKKAMEQHNLPDSTRILTFDGNHIMMFWDKVMDATYELGKVRNEKGQEEDVVFIY